MRVTRPSESYRGARRVAGVPSYPPAGVILHRPYQTKPPRIEWARLPMATERGVVLSDQIAFLIRERKEPRTYQPNGARECGRRSGDTFRAKAMAEAA
jgi:hypothetical protein